MLESKKLLMALGTVYSSTNALSEQAEGPYKETLLDLFRLVRPPMVLVGALAVDHFVREKRSTVDVDVAVSHEALERAIAEAAPSFGRAEDDGGLHLIHKKTGIRVDLLTFRIGGRFVEEALQHFVEVELDGVTVRIARPEWIVGMKLGRAGGSFAKSRLDQADVINLIKDTQPDFAPVLPLLVERERATLEELAGAARQELDRRSP